MRRVVCRLGIFAASALAGAVFAGLTEGRAGAGAKAAPVDLNLKDISGKSVRLRDFRGTPVVLNFWATWCVPCNAEMPMLVDVQKNWTAKGVAFIAASLDDRKTRAAIPEFVQRFGVSFPVWVGASANDLDRLGMGEAVPATAFIDQDGIVFARVEGQLRREELQERLTWITGDRSGPEPQPLVRHL